MAKEAAQIKIPEDIEYRVIGNAFGLLIASGGLLAGAMVSQRSLEYWREDIVPLGLLLFMGVQLVRSLVATMLLYQNMPHPRPLKRENIRSEPAVVAQLPAVPNYTPEQVVEEVARRIEAQKAEQARKSEQAEQARKNKGHN